MTTLLKEALNPSTPKERLSVLANSNNIEVVIAVAGNPSTPKEILKILADHDELRVVKAVAGNPSTPLKTLKELINDPNTPQEILIELNTNPEHKRELLKTYYERVWGFNPEKEAVKINDNKKRYEACFPLKGDDALKNINICARVDFEEEKQYTKVGKSSVSNRIILKYQGVEKSIKCVHTAVYENTISKISELTKELAKSTEHKGKHITLTPEAHFVSLKSYVKGLSEMNLQKLITSLYTPEKLPLGFNTYLVKQLFQALINLYPELRGEDQARAFIFFKKLFNLQGIKRFKKTTKISFYKNILLKTKSKTLEKLRINDKLSYLKKYLSELIKKEKTKLGKNSEETRNVIEIIKLTITEIDDLEYLLKLFAFTNQAYIKKETKELREKLTKKIIKKVSKNDIKSLIKNYRGLLPKIAQKKPECLKDNIKELIKKKLWGTLFHMAKQDWAKKILKDYEKIIKNTEVPQGSFNEILQQKLLERINS